LIASFIPSQKNFFDMHKVRSISVHGFAKAFSVPLKNFSAAKKDSERVLRSRMTISWQTQTEKCRKRRKL
jgi:hypothetical protein